MLPKCAGIYKMCYDAFSNNHLPKTSIPLAKHLQVFLHKNIYCYMFAIRMIELSDPVMEPKGFSRRAALEKEHLALRRSDT